MKETIENIPSLERSANSIAVLRIQIIRVERAIVSITITIRGRANEEINTTKARENDFFHSNDFTRG